MCSSKEDTKTIRKLEWNSLRTLYTHIISNQRNISTNIVKRDLKWYLVVSLDLRVYKTPFVYVYHLWLFVTAIFYIFDFNVFNFAAFSLNFAKLRRAKYFAFDLFASASTLKQIP